jgi:peptidoglycan hydrolase-like protein with peptidoglycan-binding domain
MPECFAILGGTTYDAVLKNGVNNSPNVAHWQKVLWVMGSYKTYLSSNTWIDAAITAASFITSISKAQDRYAVTKVGIGPVTVSQLFDGDFGPRTEAATKSYQQTLGVPATGQVDAATVKAHNAKLAASSLSTEAKGVLKVETPTGTIIPGLNDEVVKTGAKVGFGAIAAILAAVVVFARKGGKSRKGRR